MLAKNTTYNQLVNQWELEQYFDIAFLFRCYLPTILADI
jgi:hypothetical protein